VLTFSAAIPSPWLLQDQVNQQYAEHERDHTPNNLHCSRPSDPPVDHSPMSIHTANWDDYRND
jgi:hypothetical protein